MAGICTLTCSLTFLIGLILFLITSVPDKLLNCIVIDSDVDTTVIKGWSSIYLYTLTVNCTIDKTSWQGSIRKENEKYADGSTRTANKKNNCATDPDTNLRGLIQGCHCNINNTVIDPYYNFSPSS